MSCALPARLVRNAGRTVTGITFTALSPGNDHTMAPVRLDTETPGVQSLATTDSPTRKKSRQPGWLIRSRAWVDAHRPLPDPDRISWYVMFAAVSTAVATVYNPAIFFRLAVLFAIIAVWRRESATKGMLTVALIAFAAGSFLAVMSALWFYL